MSKLPNHYGSVTKLKDNRTRPFMVREGVTGQQKVIGFAKSKEEALNLLADYNRDPWSVVQEKMTFQELYDLFLEKRGTKLGESTLHSLKSVLRYCSHLLHKSYKDIKAYHMQDCIDNCGHGYATQSAIKNLFYHMDRFAIELDLTTKNFSSILTTEQPKESNKTVFTPEEREKLWENVDASWVDTILIFIYSGFRISELLEMKKEQVDLEKGTLKGGKKTKSGKNRVVPIHPKILPLIEKRMMEDGDFLISYKGQSTNISTYRKKWQQMMIQLQMNHSVHECRHTFRSLLDSAGANKVCIDRMMGHSSIGTGERTYTHKTLEELRMNLELVSN